LKYIFEKIVADSKCHGRFLVFVYLCDIPRLDAYPECA